MSWRGALRAGCCVLAGVAGGGAPRRGGAPGAPPSTIGAPGRSFATPSTITRSPALSPDSTIHRLHAVAALDPFAERDRARRGDVLAVLVLVGDVDELALRAVEHRDLRHGDRVVAHGARRASRARTGRASARRRRSAISARISNVPVDGLTRVSAKLMRPWRGNTEPSASLIVTSNALSLGSVRRPAATARSERELVVLGDRERHPDRIDLPDRRQQRVVGGDEAAFGLRRAAREAGDRRGDVRVAEVQLAPRRASPARPARGGARVRRSTRRRRLPSARPRLRSASGFRRADLAIGLRLLRLRARRRRPRRAAACACERLRDR